MIPCSDVNRTPRVTSSSSSDLAWKACFAGFVAERVFAFKDTTARSMFYGCLADSGKMGGEPKVQHPALIMKIPGACNDSVA